MKSFKEATITYAFLALLGLVTAGTAAAQAQTANQAAINLYNLGLTAYKDGSQEAAIIFFRRACDIDPDLADAHYNLAVIYQSQKRLKEAVPQFQEVLRLKPSDPDAHYQLGLCMIDLNQPTDARAVLAAIPPSDKHYPDAQKRIQLIDAGQTGSPAGSLPTLASPINSAPLQTPATNTATQPGSSYDAPAVPAANTGSIPNPNYPSAQPEQPVLTQPLQTTQPSTAPEAQPAAPHAPGGPVPIMANSTVRVIATGFNAPSGLAFDRLGNLYIANFNSNTIDRISPDGTNTPFSSGSNLKGPIGVVVDPQGNVYVANYNGGTIARINPAGVSTVIAANFKKPYYLTMDKDGNLFVSQQEDNSIVRITLPRPIGAKP